MTDLTVAKAIYEQLGGRSFSVVTGARNFVGSENSLIFKLPGGGGYTKGGINKVVITLLPSDTYQLDFYRVRAGVGKLIETYTNIYNDQLVVLFEKATGLVGNFPKSKAA